MGVNVRPCDHCGSAIRPDAVACGNCGQESEPWIQYKKLWWVQRNGAWLYLDEKQNTWQAGTVAPEVEKEMRDLKDQVFTSSLTGQARAAWEAGQQVHQVVIPLITAARTVSGILSGSTGGQWGGIKTMANSGHSFEIQSIEREGWRLEHVNAVFQETGSVSRDKLLSSGQVESVTGSVLMVYTFRRKAKGVPEKTASERREEERSGD